MERRIFVKTFVLGTGAIMVRNCNVSAGTVDQDSILVKMIYNNTGNNPDFKKEWGLAMWIEENNKAILFDTGGKPETFRKNLQTAGLDMAKLSAIIISHNHWDHTAGIPVVLENVTHKTEVYVPASDAPEIKPNNSLVTVVPVSGSLPIGGSTWSTGEMKGFLGNNVVYEQSVILSHNNLVYLFTGCAHPGIVAIVEKTKTLFPDKEIALAAGGFHLIDKSDEQIQEVSTKLNELNVKKIAPSHCSGDKAVEFLRTGWSDRFVSFNIGDNLKL
jgi:7,8-dihydropterin-6-yl-methyl-4-(beta-D-ribofuranosyl)aminobenzene 5'-phosphate synthase